MLYLEGIPISPGYASGVAVIYDLEIERRVELPQYSISHSGLASEYDRLDDALEQSTEELRRLEDSVSSELRLSKSVGLMSAHLAMAREIAALVKQHIGNEFVNVEHALNAVVSDAVARLAQLESQYFRAREQDVRDVGQRMMRHLTGSSPWANKPLPPGSVIVARELLPSETVELAKSGMVAIVSEFGGQFSHTAILARSLGIPAITGVANVTTLVRPGMQLLVDGETGSVIESTPSDVESFAKRKRDYEIRISSIAIDENLPCVTQDGVGISLLGNICLPTEVGAVAEHNLGGVGLFRTEFLFLESHERPAFDMQMEIYKSMAEGLGNLPLVIRTFDLGGDKLPPFLLSETSQTRSGLHLRGLRFSLAEDDLLDTQLRAILQVAQTADLRILFPMVIGSDDFARALAAVDKAADNLGLLRRPPIGTMIETPAALFALDEIIELADFVAVGTNDLTQYMLATDRGSAEGSEDCTAMHPAVLRAIRQIVEAAEVRQCPVCVCGEEAGIAEFACLLVGLGVRELSMTPARSAAVRHALRRIDSQDACEIADLALHCRTPKQVRELCQHFSNQTSISFLSKRDSRKSASVKCGTATDLQLTASVFDSPQSLRERNTVLRSRVADDGVRLSEAKELLTSALQEERLAAVAFQTHDSILITDKNGRILRVNKSFTKMTGYTPEDVIGKTPRVLKSDRHSEVFYRDMWQAIRNNGVWQGEIWNRRKDGSDFLQRLTIACVKNDAGETTHFVSDGEDLTKQKQGDADVLAIRAAREVQRTLFPHTAPCLPGFDIACAVHPAESVSGDFFDYIPLGQNSIGFLVADVSGHGLGPALLMAQTQASLRALAETYSDPGDLLAHVNRLFIATESDHFVTMFLGRLDTVTNRFAFQAAGHQGYLIAKDGTVRVLHATNLPLGITANFSACPAPAIILRPDDIVMIPTDGMEEAMSPDGKRFGRERLFEVVNINRDKSASQIVESLFRSARSFSSERTQSDDMTVLIVKVLPSSQERPELQPVEVTHA